MDLSTILKFFSGLVLEGCWCCLDEFNRIDTEVLSVVGTMLGNILDKVKSRSSNILMDGYVFALNSNIGVFVTMNPNYAGRS